MKIYKDLNNNLYAYELDGSQDYIIPADYILITDEEAEAIRISKIALIPKTFAPLSAWQVRKVLTQLGLRDSVETAVTNADLATKDAWNHASSFQRDDDILNGMAVSLGITGSQLDSMFELGVTL